MPLALPQRARAGAAAPADRGGDPGVIPGEIPAVLIELGLETAPRVLLHSMNESEEARVLDWIRAHDELADLVVRALEREGILVTAFPQTDVRMMPASDRLYRAIVDRRLTLPDNAELRAHAHAAIAKHSRRGWRIDKSQRSDNIDAVIAICMALDSVENQPPAVELLGWL